MSTKTAVDVFMQYRKHCFF